MSEPAPLPLATKFSHGFGAVANGSLTYMRSLILLFYSQVVGIEPWLVSVALSVSIVLDAFWDPAIGHFSDNLRTRFGRRHLLMYLAPVPAALLIAAVWNPPVGWSEEATFIWFAVTIISVNLAYSFFEVPANALTPELAPGYHQRTNLVAWRWVLGTFGALATAVMGLGYFLAPKAGDVGQLIRGGYNGLGIAVALLALFAMAVNALGTRRHVPDLHRPGRREGGALASIREALSTLRNWNMGVALTAGALAGIGFGTRTVLEAFIATYIWELPASSFLVITVAGLAAAPIGAVIGGVLSRRYGKKRACMGLFFVGTMLVNTPLLLRMLDLFFANGSPALLPTLAAIAIVSGVLNFGGFILVSSMIADIVEDAQAKTGRRAEGLITSADQFIQKIITAAGTALGGVILTLIAFPRQAKPGEVPAETLAELGWTFLALASILSFASIATWAFYRIDQTSHEARLRALGVRPPTATEPGLSGETTSGTVPILP
jgi:glycoside/pentoside/hexuronide:cation symporter, GPH family